MNPLIVLGRVTWRPSLPVKTYTAGGITGNLKGYQLKIRHNDRGIKVTKARRYLGDTEGLGEEPLNLTGTSYGDLIILGQLIHTENGNNVLEGLVVLRTITIKQVKERQTR